MKPFFLLLLNSARGLVQYKLLFGRVVFDLGIPVITQFPVKWV